ncbi:ComF family protein [Staphylococcus sp. ACRSN]|uniref:ComF family protein n=1 Tax=Staphylococcus sp. ACRSN TaxID=2918214 RepID=UPI001EF2CA18|nr:ComF family protein [Staphylococcus sp. ACRSN]MCG7340069.1 ComF family protein [Staphylococcus sp. ACRSN]
MTKCLYCQKQFIEQLNALNFYLPKSNFCQQCALLWKNITINRTENHCQRCLKQLNNSETECLDCKFLSQKYKLMGQLYCQFQYRSVMKKLLQNYKFNKDFALSQIIGEIIKLPKFKYDYIIPIPSPNERDELRTFNPVRAVLYNKKIKHHQLLKMNYRDKQAYLDKMTRLKSVNPFEVIEDIALKGKKILLVDDIYTTGLTVHQAAEKLFIRKIRKFDVFTFAR